MNLDTRNIDRHIPRVEVHSARRGFSILRSGRTAACRMSGFSYYEAPSGANLWGNLCQ